MAKKEKIVGRAAYSSVHQKKAIRSSANTITAKAFIKFAKELEKGIKSGTKSCKTK